MTKPIKKRIYRPGKRRSYHCRQCGSTEHRANNHDKAVGDQAVALVGDDALRALINPEMALLIVLNDSIDAALIGATRGQSKAPNSSTAMINAFTRLAERAATIDKAKLARARAAWEALQRAQLSYDKAVKDVRGKITPGKKES